MKLIKGDLIKLAIAGEFDVIAHGCNCFCVQGGGIAREMSKRFWTNSPWSYPSEDKKYVGDISKLGNIESYSFKLNDNPWFPENNDRWDSKNIFVTVVNCYSQYEYGTDKMNLDYEALALCFKKINHMFRGQRVGLPWIGCGLAGGDKEVVKLLMINFLKDVDLTIVEF